MGNGGTIGAPRRAAVTELMSGGMTPERGHHMAVTGGPRQEICVGKVCERWLTASSDTNSTHWPVSINHIVAGEAHRGVRNWAQIGQSSWEWLAGVAGVSFDLCDPVDDVARASSSSCMRACMACGRPEANRVMTNMRNMDTQTRTGK